MKNELNGPTAIIAIVAIVVLVLAGGFFLMNRPNLPSSGKGSGGAVEAKPYIPAGANTQAPTGGSASGAHNE